MSNESEISAISQILLACDHPIIVELGGYHGEDTDWMTRLVADRFPRAIIVEPDRENYTAILGTKMIALMGKQIHVSVVHGAIADHTGTCDFWACYTPDGRGSGSIRRPTGHLVEKPWYDFRKLAGQIPCYSLDYIFEEHKLTHIDVLWVDIQGAERDMIAGGQEALKHARFLFIEAEERELYEGQALRPDLMTMLPGWTVLATFEQNVLLRNVEVAPSVERAKAPVLHKRGRCPRCGSDAVSLAGGMRHCNQCGESWA